MAENFISYKDKPLVRCKNEIYYGDMADAFVIKFTILSEDANGEPDKIKVELLKSDTSLNAKDRFVKDTTKSSMFEALDVGFVWLERALKS